MRLTLELLGRILEITLYPPEDAETEPTFALHSETELAPEPFGFGAPDETEE